MGVSEFLPKSADIKQFLGPIVSIEGGRVAVGQVVDLELSVDLMPTAIDAAMTTKPSEYL